MSSEQIETFYFCMIVCAICEVALCGVIGSYIATQKNRDETEGALFGAFLGPIGLLIEACLPTLPETEVKEFRKGFRD